MADPVVVPCPVDVWTKVATDVVTGLVHRMSTAPAKYFQTYRLTGEAAPADLTDAVPAFCECDVDNISALAGIDVYIYATGAAGKVRVDV